MPTAYVAIVSTTNEHKACRFVYHLIVKHEMFLWGLSKYSTVVKYCVLSYNQEYLDNP